ncbi:isoleucine--tRNA ligase [Ferrimicrobium acidiphilum]|uniref:isoleucine--tRNA ligase n=1 Tax=Ferrimicrobium acidiphilum TaxID=121039 RepID=UPI0023F1DCCB|nr:isoleucine--tRNA ligase [Ferrimicrobium acidiphilum]
MSDHEEKNSYPHQPGSLDLPKLEHEILAFWEQDDTFRASIAQRRKDGGKAFVFYDGPPFANGSPHYGHLLTGFVKDAIPRYQTMQGKVVERRFGWDCHGLPAEMAAEKELGVSGREEVEQLGIDRFNDHCRALVQRTTDDWYRYVTRQARWVDFVDSYKTMDTSFMESVIWAFKRLHDKGLVYEHYRVLPYCWECETPLSNFETRQDDSYRPRIDPAITVAFQLPTRQDGAQQGFEAIVDGELHLLAWTTTPWTLPSNLALAVNPEFEYVLFCNGDDPRVFVMASDRLGSYQDRFEAPQILGTVPGVRLLGREFVPLFPFFSGTPNAFRVIEGSFVTIDEGTGIVQMAPGFGEEDQQACEAASIKVVCPVDEKGRYTHEVSWYEGTQVFEANEAIKTYLEEHNLLIEAKPYEHSYPHCWRTDTPLIYKAVSSWFVNVTAIKERLLELNQDIAWVPEHVKNGAFGKWLEGARDWSITRNRYWGSPIPVWKSDDPRYPRVDVYGSLDEIEADFGVRPDDLHRPRIDELVRPNPDDPTGNAMMRRVPDVLDCWFESGSMPFAQQHYPFEHRETFEANFPADFIVEFIGQTRGWFYTLHVLSVGLFDSPPFKHCMAHGILLGNDGRKLSKRLKNFPDPWEVFEEIGADAMRWFLLSSSVLRGQEMLLERQAMVDTVKRVINPIWNAFSFLTLYAEADGIRGRFDANSEHLLDRYILAKSHQLTQEVTEALDNFDLSRATGRIEDFLDALNNWYIRRSRDRFWAAKGSAEDIDLSKQLAYDTLHTVLENLSTLTAPLLPMLSEYLYRTLTGERSVHLADWPSPDRLGAKDSKLVEEMELVREICSQVHSIRKATGNRARLPLRSVTVASLTPLDLTPYLDLIEAETNVKTVLITDDFDRFAHQRLSVNPATLGPRIGAATQQVIRAIREGEYTMEDGQPVVAGVRLEAGEYSLTLEAVDPRSMRVLSDRSTVVALDLTTDEALELEGLARDLIRAIQQHRKGSGYDVTDRIDLVLVLTDPNHRLGKAIGEHAADITAQTLATTLELVRDPDGLSQPTEVDLDGISITISTTLAST